MRRLFIELTRHRACNAVLVKLIDQENLMSEFADVHDEPNIDASYIKFVGHHIELPDTTALSC